MRTTTLSNLLSVNMFRQSIGTIFSISGLDFYLSCLLSGRLIYSEASSIITSYVLNILEYGLHIGLNITVCSLAFSFYFPFIFNRCANLRLLIPHIVLCSKSPHFPLFLGIFSSCSLLRHCGSDPQSFYRRAVLLLPAKWPESPQRHTSPFRKYPCFFRKTHLFP
jgi:hypothetical protein